MTSEDLLKHFTNQQVQLKADIREMIVDSNIGTHAKIIDEVEKIEVKIDTIIYHQEKQNSKLLIHEEKIRGIELKNIEIATYQSSCPAAKMSRDWKTMLLLFIFTIFFVQYAYDFISWDILWQLIRTLF